MSFLVAPAAGAFADRLGVRWFMLAGLAAVGLGLWLMAGLEPGDDWTTLLPGFLIAGLGIGLANPPLASAAIGVVDARRSGMASGINSTFRQVGLATGIATWGALFENRVTSVFRDGATAVHFDATRFNGNIAEFVSFGVARRTGNPALIRIAEEAFISGLRLILVVAAVMALVGAVLVGVLVRPRDFVAHTDDATDIDNEPGENRFEPAPEERAGLD
jgi:MFS family permease